MHKGITTKSAFFFGVLEPEIERNVLVVRRKFRIVIKGFTVIKPASRRLRSQKHVIPYLNSGDYKISSTLVFPDHDLSRSRAPLFNNLLLFLFRKFREPYFICAFRDENYLACSNHLLEFSGSPGTYIDALGKHQIK
ncbi:hypothetical protein DSECCO2_538180 [anaerobic digester metagenome]